MAGAKVFDGYESVTSPAQALQRTIRIDGKTTQPLSILIFSGAIQNAQPGSFQSGEFKVQVTGGAFRYGNNTVVLDLKTEGAKILYSW